MNILLFLINKSKADDLSLLIAKGALVVSVMLGFNALTTSNTMNGEVEEVINDQSRRDREEARRNDDRKRKTKKLQDVGGGLSIKLSMRVAGDGTIYTVKETVNTNEYLSNEYDKDIRISSPLSIATIESECTSAIRNR